MDSCMYACMYSCSSSMHVCMHAYTYIKNGWTENKRHGGIKVLGYSGPQGLFVPEVIEAFIHRLFLVHHKGQQIAQA